MKNLYLKNYIKNINEFLLTEENEGQIEDENSNTTNNILEALQNLLQEFREFLQKIDGKTTLEEIQAVANGQEIAPINDMQQPAQTEQ